uniref:Uncharacterized protein n=1 Tax=Salix viminalis TaxID=40686 RepID=A0A6N2L0Y3_SALVM
MVLEGKMQGYAAWKGRSTLGNSAVAGEDVVSDSFSRMDARSVLETVLCSNHPGLSTVIGIIRWLTTSKENRLKLVAFLPKGVELPSGIMFICVQRVYDITNKCMEHQEEVDHLLNKNTFRNACNSAAWWTLSKASEWTKHRHPSQSLTRKQWKSEISKFTDRGNYDSEGVEKCLGLACVDEWLQRSIKGKNGDGIAPRW